MTQWYRSPWVQGSAAVVGGAALATGVAYAALRSGGCEGVGTDGGTVAGVRYLERIRGGAEPNAPLPMVIIFHSRGARPEGMASGLGGIGPARVILPEGELETPGGGRNWWSMGIRNAVNSGQIEQAAAERKRALRRIRRFIDQISKCRPTLGKPILTGSSQGAEMTLLVASAEPRHVAGGVAVAGYLLDPFWNDNMAPVAMIHGRGDNTVPFSWAQQYAATMQGQGAPLTFDAFSSSGHQITSAMSRAWIDKLSSMTRSVSALA